MRELSDERLTVAEIERALMPTDTFPGINRSAIQRFDANADLREILGKENDTYPPESLKYWRIIAEARSRKPPLVAPATAALFLRSLMASEGQGTSPFVVLEEAPDRPEPKERKNPIGGIGGRESVAGALALPDGAEELLTRIVAAAAKAVALEMVPALPGSGASDDRLLNLKEARDLTGLSQATIRSLPKVQERPGGVHKWKKSVLMAYLRGL